MKKRAHICAGYFKVMKNDCSIVKQGFITGLGKGWSGFLWVLKIFIPISFLTALMEWGGLINRLDFLLQPIMGWIHLPPAAALPIIMGMLVGIYSGIAAMAVLSFTPDQMTLMAIFMMIAHSLVQEGIIQTKSGLHWAKGTLIRLAAAFATTLICAQFLPSTEIPLSNAAATPSSYTSFLEMLRSWGLATLHLTAIIFGVMMIILTLLEVLKTLGWIHYVVDFFSPILRLMGLSPRVGFLWITGAVFGLIYSSAIIFEEAKEGHLTKEELEELHLSIGLHHSFVEDPLIFLALGLGAFWLWVPRLVAAMVVVRLYTLGQRLMKRSATAG